jgi:hypothetical protein
VLTKQILTHGISQKQIDCLSRTLSFVESSQLFSNNVSDVPGLSIWVKIRLHTKNQLPGLSGSALNVSLGGGGGGGGWSY